MSVYYALIRTNDGVCWEERNGTRVKNDYCLELFAERRSKNNFVITEGRSGLSIGEGALKRIAISNVIEKIEYYGMDFVNRKVNESIERYGESPLFTNSPKLPILNMVKEVHG